MSDPAFAPEDAWILANPDQSYDDFLAAGFSGTRNAFLLRRSKFIKRGQLERRPGSPFSRTPNPDALVPKDGAPDVRHNKPDVSFDDQSLIDLARQRQALRKPMSRSLDFPEFFIESGRPVPILFIADWHIGSWGTDYDEINDTINEIERLNLKIVILGDMLQMAKNMSQGLAALRDACLDEAEQDRWIEAFVARFAPQILWVTWDNHVVMRQEKTEGFSRYAELMKDKVVYSNGINHVDLMVGAADFETYKICSSHRFRFRSMYNAVHGQQQYMRLQGIDREIAIAGDSHTPAAASYYDGPLHRAAVNVGSPQDDSAYSKRFFSLYTHNDMPVIEFWPDKHLFHVYPNLQEYKDVRGV